jgi:hypothetical protein
MESGASLDKEGNLKVGSPLEMASMHYQQVTSRIQEWIRTIESNPTKLSLGRVFGHGACGHFR